MKTYRWNGCISQAFLNSALDGGEWTASRPGRFGKEAGWAPEAVWTRWQKKISSLPLMRIEPIMTELPRLHI
jgi:hypothetical protein